MTLKFLHISAVSIFLILVTGNAFSANQQIVAGYNHTVALKSNGTVLAWGNNAYGQLGDGTVIDRPLPTPVLGLTGVIKVAAGNYRTVALKSDGCLWTWGENTGGYLGIGSYDGNPHPEPILIQGFTNIIDIASGSLHTLALKSDGSLWAWGYNFFGQIGNGTQNRSTSPIQVPGMTNVKEIAASGDHSFALKNDGTLWAWGENQRGFLGNNSNSGGTFTPVNVLSGVSKIFTGNCITIAIKNNGTAWAWGDNYSGEICGATSNEQKTPFQVSCISNISKIVMGCAFIIMLKSDGSIWSWGSNQSGLLGIGSADSDSHITPIELTSIRNAVDISTSGEHVTVLKDDGSVLAWGQNYYGQLGDGTSHDNNVPNVKYSPVQVKSVSGNNFLNLNTPGDIDGNTLVQLKDAILALQVNSGIDPVSKIYRQVDVDGDQKIGLAEAIYALQCIARLRNNNPPAWTTIANKTVDEGATLSFTLLASDADGDSLAYSVSALPERASFDSITRVFSWTPNYSQAGSYQITFTARDDYGGSTSQTITITVNDKTLPFTALDYFPLNIGDWQDFRYSSSGLIHRSNVTGPRYIGSVATKERVYWDGQKDYYTSDSNGTKLYGQHVISPNFTGDVYFASPLLLMPNNAQIGTTQVSNSSYTFTISGYLYHADITSTTTIIGLEDLVIGSHTLLDCIKVSLRFDQYVTETGQSVPGSTIYYWFYKGVGCVKQVMDGDTYTITGSYVNGVQQTF